ncbi:hypothetical protein TWF788_002136 [Orbilia oligospora]|uniref:Uncharacterized protein n=1 Tax=Orbilia oligospora TaxID=2813651 RepID=A0A7C8P4L4_ORBOL|nr:hypothetical protein TWF788_002136 [Orbilia oligospora]
MQRRRSSCGDDETIASSKIEPLASPTKYHTPTVHDGGCVGDDDILDSSRVGAMKKEKKYQHPTAQVHPGGSTGTDETIGSTNVDPLFSKGKNTTRKDSLDDGKIDGARIALSKVDPAGSAEAAAYVNCEIENPVGGNID